MSTPTDPDQQLLETHRRQSPPQHNQQVTDLVSQPEPQAHSRELSNPVEKLATTGSFFVGMTLGLALLVLGGLGYLLAITVLQPDHLALPWDVVPSGNSGTKAIDPTRTKSLLDSGHNNSATQSASNGGQTDHQVSLSCLSSQPELLVLADPSNYGPRLTADWQGRPVGNRPSLIVLHETMVDEKTALALFRSPHNSDARQASYHVLIGRDGRPIRVVPDSERAYGAGDSDFSGMAVQLKPGLPPSLNNISLHVSLVSPPDGADGERRQHSGYTGEQYRSLASQIAQWKLLYGIGPGFVVTHQEVDRSGSRRDPRSFSWAQLSQELRSHWLACGGSPITADLGRSSGRSPGR